MFNRTAQWLFEPADVERYVLATTPPATCVPVRGLV
jgi:hypothetical protein